MNELTQNQALLIHIFQVIAFVFCFVLVMTLGIYNWLYLAKILKSNDSIGLRPPQHICHLIKTSIYIPVFTAFCICLFILFRLY